MVQVMFALWQLKEVMGMRREPNPSCEYVVLTAFFEQVEHRLGWDQDEGLIHVQDLENE
jgi:hypothetical protein